MIAGILYICTGQYKIFWKDFYLSCEKNFLKGVDKRYFVFTDAEYIDFEKEKCNIHKIYQKNLGWPDNTLRRFEMFLKEKETIKMADYLFFFNANLLVTEEIKKEDIIPQGEEVLVACIHPGFINKNKDTFPYEKNTLSLAYIKKRTQKHYFAGGLNGGKTNDFIFAIEKMKKNIDIDLNNKIIAIWHDESHWNKFIIDNEKKIKYLSPDLLYPEGFNLNLNPKILLRSKDRFFNTSKAHNQKKITKKIMVQIVQKIQSKIKYLSFMVFDKTFLSKITLKYKSGLNNISCQKISVAISSYHREKLIHKSLFNILNDNRIDEIVILDDGSSEESFNKTEKIIRAINNNKIKLYRRKYNLGVLPTKIEAVSLCKNEWVILLDSDNTICKSYIDGLYMNNNWSEDTIYSPSFAYPLLDFRNLSNKKIDLQTLKNLLIKETLTTERFLNDGNFFFNKNRFLELVLPYKFICAQASDIILINYIWLINNNIIYIIPNTKYLHRVHIKSIWKELQQSSSKVFEYLRYNILLENNKNLEEIKKDLGSNPEIESKIEKIL